jgi:hypothetical protein
MPMMPTVECHSSKRRSSPLGPLRHSPACTAPFSSTRRFIVASMSMMACSATAMAFAPPLTATGTPAARAASRSNVS